MHKPVLLNEVIEYLDPKPGENFVDCTVGQGGHTNVLLEKIAPNGKVLGIDLDKDKMISMKTDRLILVNDNYANLENILEENNFKNINGILLDLGFSSEQLEGKGMSFLKNELLDMRYCATSQITAVDIVNIWPEEKIERILEDYGEEKFAKQIAREIVIQRKNKKIQTTFDLVEIVNKAVGKKYGFTKIHPATRTFQALRIAVNNELDNLQKVLPQAFSALQNGGKLAVISFHSLEDRIVKNYFKQKEQEGSIKLLTKKPVQAQDQEIAENSRSRSAKLRVVIKI